MSKITCEIYRNFCREDDRRREEKLTCAEKMLRINNQSTKWTTFVTKQICSHKSILVWGEYKLQKWNFWSTYRLPIQWSFDYSQFTPAKRGAVRFKYSFAIAQFFWEFPTPFFSNIKKKKKYPLLRLILILPRMNYGQGATPLSMFFSSFYQPISAQNKLFHIPIIGERRA